MTQRRRQTRNSIYHYLYDTREFCSKQSLARDLRLSLPTVYQHLTELMEEGLVRYSGEQQSTGGRKAMGLEIVADARYAIGVSVTETRLRFVAADLRLGEMAYRKVHHPSVAEMENFGDFLTRELERFIDDNALDRDRLLGVGIALPAVIAPDESRRITLAPTLHLRDVELQRLMGTIPYPVYIENDATSGGYAEWFTHWQGRDIAYLLLEIGVGGAILVNGGQYQGVNHRSGEFGHMCVEPGGLPCKCGKRGCLEAYCSPSRVSEDLGISLKEFFDGLERHVPEYETLWYDLLRHLAIGVNNIRMALDCDVVLGGFLTEFLPPYMPLLKEYVAAGNTFEPSADYLHLSNLRRHTVPLGVALHFIKEFLETI